MKCKIEQADLAHVMGVICNAIPSHTPSPAILCVYIEANENVTLSGTDMSLWVHGGVEAQVKDPGIAVVDAKSLWSIAKACGGGSISLESSGSKLKVVGGGDKYSLATVDPDRFPPSPEYSDEGQIELDAEHLGQLLDWASVSVGKTDSRYVLTGIQMLTDAGRVVFRSTDGRRVSQAESESTECSPLGREPVLPRKAVELARKAIREGDEALIGVMDGNVVINVGSVDIVTPELYGRSPDYKSCTEKWLSKKLKYQDIPIDPKEVLLALKKASILLLAESQGLSLKVCEGFLHIDSDTLEKGAAKIMVEIEDGYEEASVFVDSRYLIQALNSVKSDTCVLHIPSGKDNPIRVTSSEGRLLHIVHILQP